MIMKIWLHIGKNPIKASCSKQVWFVPNVFGKSKDRCHPPKETLLFLLSFKLGNTAPNTLTYTKLLYNYEHFFFLKTGNLISNWILLSLLQAYLAWKTIPTIWLSMKSRRLQKSQFLNSSVNWVQLGNTASTYIKKKIHPFFPWIGKGRKV